MWQDFFAGELNHCRERGRISVKFIITFLPNKRNTNFTYIYPTILCQRRSFNRFYKIEIACILKLNLIISESRKFLRF